MGRAPTSLWPVNQVRPVNLVQSYTLPRVKTQLERVTAIVSGVVGIAAADLDPADNLETLAGMTEEELRTILAKLMREFGTSLSTDIGMRCQSIYALDNLVTNALY